MKRIHVVAAVIERGDEILIARRPDHVHQGGKWEFPGGKLEAGESAADGVVREIREELGVTVTAQQPLIRISHDYPDKQVLLDVWRVTAFEGQPAGMEGQDVRWVARADLRHFDFPAANVPIVAAVQLPPLYVISPDTESVARFMADLEATVASGARLIQIRVFALTSADWRELLSALQCLRNRVDVTFLINSATARRYAVGEDFSTVFSGIHLTSADLLTLRRRPAHCQWVAASCHSWEEIERAERIGVDFVTLSPVRPTRSHPDVRPLGVEQFAQWVEGARLPVYGLGGLQAGDVQQLQALGAHGVAGISGFWKTGS